MTDTSHDFLFDCSEPIDIKNLGNTNWEIPILPPMDQSTFAHSVWQNWSSFEKNEASWEFTNKFPHESVAPDQALTDPFDHLREWSSNVDVLMPSEPSSIGCIVNRCSQAALVSPMGSCAGAGCIPLQSSPSVNLVEKSTSQPLSISPIKSGSSTLECSDDSICSEVTGPSEIVLFDEMMNTMSDGHGVLQFFDNGQVSKRSYSTFDAAALGKSFDWIKSCLGFDGSKRQRTKEQDGKDFWGMQSMKASSQDANPHGVLQQNMFGSLPAPKVDAKCQNGSFPDLKPSDPQSGFTCEKHVKHCSLERISLVEDDSKTSDIGGLHKQPDSSVTFGIASKDGVDTLSYHELDFVKQKEAKSNSLLGVKFKLGYDESSIVNLVIAAAEAVVACNGDLASVILARLNELVSCSESSMQRVAAYFSAGLQSRIGEVQTPDITGVRVSQNEMLSAFQIFHEVSPYIKFGHFTANQAILEAIDGEKQVHIVDFEIMEGIQWPPLMQALALRKEGAPRLHITVLCRSCEHQTWPSTKATGRRLYEFAASIGLPFTFSLMKVSEDEGFDPSALKVMKGEAVVGNCMLHLPHMPYRNASSVASFLRGVRTASPVILTLVEEELGSGSTTQYLYGALHHYCTVFDSLDACLPGEAVVRTLVERVFFRPRINSLMACLNGGLSSSYGGLSSCSSSVSSTVSSAPSSYQGESDHAVTCSWSSLVRSMGFKSLPLSTNNLSQARLLLGLYQDGFKLQQQSNRLLLGWCSFNIYAASVWS